VKTTAHIALGSNLGDRLAHLRGALRGLAARADTRVLRVSPVYETAPVGPQDQGAYLNAAAAVQTTLSARALRRVLIGLEDAAGRDRSVQRWGPRTLDLDLLMFGGERIASDALTVPHPRLHERWFVLRPLCDIAAEARVPLAGADEPWPTVASLLEAVSPDALAAEPFALFTEAEPLAGSVR